ncbi:conserved protein of unknown function [Ectopseudomonas oleovorans]|uniref:Uncharacterized protein n=1 Tax=Ectopseudomonas oleovorans TaxID=301 RepID=A0A653B7E1_ECTOL|nr:conserved protein of unknown function [Pseudomonas oleovorans]
MASSSHGIGRNFAFSLVYDAHRCRVCPKPKAREQHFRRQLYMKTFLYSFCPNRSL